MPPEKMSDEQIAGVLGFSVMSATAIAYLAIGRAIEAARDAQWQEANDALAAEVDRLQAQINNADCEWQARLNAAVAHGEAVAWRPRMNFYGWEKQSVWTIGTPAQEDIDYWSSLGLSIQYAHAK
jgi:hypothetical protein